jgi:hypothetical protein
LSAPTAETTAPTVAEETDLGSGGAPRWGGWRIYATLLGAAVVIAALSLLIPSTPSYDPWSWLVWGREIEHFSLHLPGGPTWKPLPVIFTTLLAPFGRAQPDLWLVIARTGAIMAVLMVFKLSARLVWWLRSEDEGAAGIVAYAPAALAGLIAAVALALSGNLVSDGALGYSEGLLTAAALVAVELHLDGHRRAAFVLGFVAALGRPEIWVFWGPYGLWLMWKDPGARGLVIGLGLLTLFLWFVPQKLGGGSFTQGVSRAQHPRKNSAAFASCPFCTELSHHAWRLVLLRVKLAAVLGIGAAGAALVAVWRARPRVFARRERALLAIAACGLFGFGWWILVAFETQAGFSGNDRYLVLGSAFVEVAGAAAFGWAALSLAGLARRLVSGSRARQPASPAVRLGAATALSGLVFLLAPNWVGANLIDVSRTHRSLDYQAALRRDVEALIARDGGARRMVACGSVMTEGFQVPMVAWYLGLRTIQVLDQPVVDAHGVAAQPPPATILQTRDTRSATLLPLWATIRAWERAGAHYRIVTTPTIRFFQACGK